MPNYDVVDEAVIDADISIVFKAMLDANNYSKWWMPHVEEKIRRGEKILRKGSVVDIKVHRIGTLTFAGRIIDIIDNKSIKLDYFEGDFIGTCEYTFESINGKTKIRFRWEVRSNRFLLKMLSIFAPKSFPKGHSEVMQLGFKGLNHYLTQKKKEGVV